jgi:hypothetical protein
MGGGNTINVQITHFSTLATDHQPKYHSGWYRVFYVSANLTTITALVLHWMNSGYQAPASSLHTAAMVTHEPEEG